MRKTKFFFICCFLLLASASGVFAQQDDKLLQVLKDELNKEMQELQKTENPPYHMNFRVMDEKVVNISANFGVLQGVREQHTRTLVPQVRVGSMELDNFKYNPMGSPTTTRTSSSMAYLPIEGDNWEDAIRQAIWAETESRYEFAVESYQQAKTKSTVSVADEDKAPCFSEAPVEKYYEAPLPADKQTIDKEVWEKRMKEVSAAFKEFPQLQMGTAGITFKVLRTYFVNTEGTEVVQNRTYARVMLSATLKADDGMELPLNMDFFAYDPNDLPDNATMIAGVKDMIERLKALEKAPVADPYTGPAILSGPASGVFFHEIFGHRIEGHRLKGGGETFKKMVGEEVLPKEFQVYCDPTMRDYHGVKLNGFYLYDDQGVKARRVDVVKDGVLREFLMSRVPLDGFPQSNGHGRTSGGGDPVSRQSNLVVETTAPYTEADLRQMLLEEAKKQGKEYGYYFRTVTSGFTLTGEGGSLNSFNVTPLEVYRVFVDGRPDELVRGVDLIGTPLSMFSNIKAAGDTPSTFTGECGAESGWVPVTASSPMIFCTKIETQRREKSKDLPPILPAPDAK